MPILVILDASPGLVLVRAAPAVSDDAVGWLTFVTTADTRREPWQSISPIRTRARATKASALEQLENRELLSTVGTFEGGQWRLDANENHAWDAPAGGDVQVSLGELRDVPIAGDWSGLGHDQIGVYRAGNWLLDANDNRTWDTAAGGDRQLVLGGATKRPVVGDWAGLGTDQIGVFRSGVWQFDTNGNGRWDGAKGGDVQVRFGGSGDLPVVGDWNGDGTDEIGVYSKKQFRLDTNGNGRWDGATGGDTLIRFGAAGDVPVVGDWNGDGRDEVGSFRAGQWKLRTGGSSTVFQFGLATAAPVVLDLSPGSPPANHAPVLGAISDKSVNEGSLLSFTAMATDSDVPANSLSFSLGAGAPAGASIHATTGVFSWTPTEAQGPGSYSVTVRVTDNGSPNLSDSKAFTVTVGEVNQAPVLGTIGNKSARAGSALAFTATATDSDLPQQTLTFSLDAGAPAGASIDAATGAFSWTPTQAQASNSYSITVRVTDSGTPNLNDAETITVTVDSADALIYSHDAQLSLDGNNLLNEPHSASLNLGSGGAYTFALWMNHATVSGNQFVFNKAGDAFTDGYGLTVQGGNWTWYQPGTNAEMTVAASTGWHHLAIVRSGTGANGLAFYVDGVLSASGNSDGINPDTSAALELGGRDHGSFQWYATGAMERFRIYARALSTQEIADLASTPPPPGSNQSPVLGAIGSKTVQVGNTLSFSATATDADVPPQVLSFSLDAGAPAGTSINATTGAFSWTPTQAQASASPYSVTVRVTDNGTPNLSDSETITITVQGSSGANQPPVLAAIGNKVVQVGSSLSFTATATDPDVPPQTLAFSLDTGAPAGTTINATSGAFSWTPTSAQANASYSVTVRVTDSGSPKLSDTETFTIAVQSQGSTIVTPHDTIPNFAVNPTIVSAASGPWSNVNSWSLNRLPTANDVVVISANTTVTVDTTSAIALTIGVQAGGTLRFRTDVNTHLSVGTLLVLEGGSLEVGTAATPVSATVSAGITIRDIPINTTIDPRQFGTGLIALGKVTMHGRSLNQTFVRLATEPRAGDTTLTLSQPVTGWRAGDTLILPDSRQLRTSDRDQWGNWLSPQWEERTLAGVSADGRTLTLTAPLQFTHPGAKDPNGNPTVLADGTRFLPHVGNLARNVMIESENPNGTRGHTFFTHRADVDMRYVGFCELGRTTLDPLDSATFDANGQVTHIGTNQVGRYPMHLHHLIGPATTPANGNQFTLIGNTVDDDSANNQHKWGITLHDSHYGLIQQNVIYNAAGAGLVTEDGSESFNVIERNFVVRTPGTGERAIKEFSDNKPGVGGSGFWFRGANNFVRDNVSADPRYYGFTIVELGLTGIAHIPAFKGADPTIPGQFLDLNIMSTPMLEFSRNEVYGMTENGLTIWNVGTEGETTQEVRYSVGESVIRDFRAWHFYYLGYFGYPANRLTFDGLVMRGDMNAITAREPLGTLGFHTGDYMNRSLTIRRADIQGLVGGIEAPRNGNPYGATGTQLGSTVIEDSYLRNYFDISVPSHYSGNAGGAALAPKRTVIRNVRFDNLNVAVNPDWGPQRTIAMSYLTNQSGVNHIQSDTVFVYDYDGVAGDNFQVFYEEQRPDFVVPESKNWDNDGPSMVGAPFGDVGLTNAQLVAKYPNGVTILGQFYPVVAIAGGVATGTTTRPEIDGLIRAFA